MRKKLFFIASCLVLAAVLVIGCKRQSSTQSANPSGYFKTPFQDESQFIVDAIVSDLAEQMFYAASHKLPDPDYFQVTATEKAGSPHDAPVYELQIRLDPKQGTVNSEVDVNGPIWDPAVYTNVMADLARAVRLSPGIADEAQDTGLLSKLTDNTPETIEQDNEDLSSSLEGDFKNPALHEQAAALLGAFLLRDHSGHFFEIRSPLCRMTAHLAMAKFLNGDSAFGINGQMAEAMLLTLIGDQSPALVQLNAIGTNDATIAPIVRALWTRNTGDYRLLGQMNGLTPMESAEWFCTMSGYVSTELAWPKLSDVQQRTIDFVRIANQEDYSVEMGHQLSDVAIRLELQEIQKVYSLSHHELLGREQLIKALNEMPERCFTTVSGGAHVRIIGWGQWADFLQRHLCHAIQQNFYFLQYKWGVPDDAKEFASKSDKALSGLRLYPFVERFDCLDVDSYHKSEDDGFKVTVANNQPNYDQAAALYGDMPAYSLEAVWAIAKTVKSDPQQYEKLMLQAAQMDPSCYYTLARYAVDRHEDDQAAEYYEKGCAADPDSVRVSNLALWRVRYYLKKGNTEKARQIADDAGQVYSSDGLEAEAVYFETTRNYDQAFQWYYNIEERYNDSGPLIAFCLRYKSMTGDARFDSEVNKRIGKVFPKGMEKVSLTDFSKPPGDGVLIQEQNDTLLAAGLKAGDVIVALGGMRTHTFAQYTFVRDLQTSPELDLIVWQGNAYHEIKASPPERRFGVDFGDYQSQ